jgi:hypothetical protein
MSANAPVCGRSRFEESACFEGGGYSIKGLPEKEVHYEPLYTRMFP